MGLAGSGFFAKRGMTRGGLAVALALMLPVPPSVAAGMTVPTCAQIADFGRAWVGLDEERLSQGLGVPLYQVTDGDIDLIKQTMQHCMEASDKAEEKTVLAQEIKGIASLRAARDRVRRAHAVFETALQKARPKLEQITAKLDALQATPASRIAVDDAEATVSATFFELEQKRVRAQVPETLMESFRPYAAAVAALGRKRQAYAEAARKELVADAQDAYEKHRAEFDRLGLPAAAQDATIILEGIDAGGDVRWLTLRQWAALVLSNPQVGSVTVAAGAADAGIVEFGVIRPGYSAAAFAFRQDGRDLRLMVGAADGRPGNAAADDRRKANRLLIEVARAR
jgi:hypothetical protein